MTKQKHKSNHKHPKPHYPKNKPVKELAVCTSMLNASGTSTQKVELCKVTEVSVVAKYPEAPLDFSKTITLQFSAIDSLFFRESRPMESMGELQSIFPPSVRTLAGAVRSCIGENWMAERPNEDWSKFDTMNRAHDKDPNKVPHELRAVIGFGDDLGPLNFHGAWLKMGSQRLYPMPLHLFQKDSNKQPTGSSEKNEGLFTLSLDKQAIECDLGKGVRLPKMPEGEEYKGATSLENHWVSEQGLIKILEDQYPRLKKPAPEKPEVYKSSELFKRESRLGIARDNQTRGVMDGLLYQTQHVRPRQNLTIELDVDGLSPDMPSNVIVRLGGEARPANISLVQKHQKIPRINAKLIENNKFTIYLLTPLPIRPNEHLPFSEAVQAKEIDGYTVWEGALAVKDKKLVHIRLHGAVTGKVLREGGWDMAQHAPRTVTNFIPAGSVFYCEALQDTTIDDIMDTLHDQRIGSLSKYGFGHVAIGVWTD